MSECKNNKKTDWESIERDYCAGVLSIREVAKLHCLSDTAIRKKAKSANWDRAEVMAESRVVLLKEIDDFDRSGFVYVIYIDAGLDRFYKIGLAKNFSSRVDQHQCASPFDICVACCYFVVNMRAEERELHAMFSGSRVRGEWFTLTKADLKLIAARSMLVSYE